VQSSEQLGQAAEELGSRAENIANVTYIAPTETGDVETVVDEHTIKGQHLRPTASAAAAAVAGATLSRVGRNDPCPCGSGKKYKHCHGKLA